MAIDVASGWLGRGYIKPEFGGCWVERHPDTDQPFTGLSVPMWDRILSVCERAARVIPGVRSLGWDVLLAGDGPVILETNAAWDLRMVQVHTADYLARPGVRDELRKHGVSLRDTLPGLGTACRRWALGRFREWVATGCRFVDG